MGVACLLPSCCHLSPASCAAQTAACSSTCLATHLTRPQHGQGRNSKFSVDWLIDSANTAAGGTPGTGVDETKWLRAFLKARYDLLFNWDPVARVSVKRIEIYRKLLDTGGC